MSSDDRPAFRREVLCFPGADGGLDLLDLLFDRVVRIAPEQAAAFAAGDPDVRQHLARLQLFDSPEVEAFRAKALGARLAEPQPPPPAPPIGDVDWSEAERWPDMVARAWKDPERLRRLAEDRAGGRRYLMLRGFLEPDAARAIARETEALPSASKATSSAATSACCAATSCATGACCFLEGARAGCSADCSDVNCRTAS